MPQGSLVESRSGPRYVHAFPIRAEWDTNDGVHIVAEGETENVGPEGTLVHLQRDLPPVGGRVNLQVLDEKGEKLSNRRAVGEFRPRRQDSARCKRKSRAPGRRHPVPFTTPALRPGKNPVTFTVTLDRPQFHTFEAIVETPAGADTLPENNTALGFTEAGRQGEYVVMTREL